MLILGLSDGFRGAASLVADDVLAGCEIQECHDRRPGVPGTPWAAVEALLEGAGRTPQEIDLVAVAGRFSPPFFVRRHPGVRRLTTDPFSPLLDVEVVYEALLRQSGIGALEEDRVAAWFQDRLAERGITPRRVVMVDVHAALAAAAYRTQSDDDVLVLTLHPLGDGVSCAVHHGRLGQLERVWAQRGFGALHLHLQRVAAVLGLEPLGDLHLLSGLAGKGEPDAELLDLLAREVRAEGPRLSRHAYPRPVRREEPLYAALAEASPEDAAASVVLNLARTVRELLGWHVRRSGVPRVAVAGAAFGDPRLVAAAAEVEGVTSVGVAPDPDWPALALGAAAWLAGLAPHRAPAAGLGRRYEDSLLSRALAASELPRRRPRALAREVADRLARRLAVARFDGPGGWGPLGGGTRSVLVRADDPAALEHARTRLGRDPREEPLCLWLEDEADGRVRDRARLAVPLRHGVAAVQVDEVFAERYPPVVARDGRVRLLVVEEDGDPALGAVLRTLRATTGCGALAALPFAQGREPPVAVPGDGIRAWDRAELDVLWLGPFLVDRIAIGSGE